MVENPVQLIEEHGLAIGLLCGGAGLGLGLFAGGPEAVAEPSVFLILVTTAIAAVVMSASAGQREC